MTRPSCYSHSAPTTTPSPRTPPEIFDAVIDELASNRKDLASFDALLRCSLVSRQAYWRSRIHIFEEVNLGWTKTALTHQESQGLTCGTVFGLVELITHNPLLSERISSLRINPSFYYASSGRDNLCENLSTLLGQLPHLQRFALTSGSDPDAPSIPWSWFPAMVQSAIQVCCARPSIKGVEFRGFVGIPSTLLSSCSSSLTTLYISRAFNATVLEPGDLDFVDHALSGGPRKRPPWSLESLVCQNALPLLRSAIQHDSDPDESPFSGLQHLNVAVLTHDDSNLVAPLLGQSKDSIRKLEVSFTLWSDNVAFAVDWVHLPLLQRLHVAICCTQVQDTVHFPPDVPNLIYNVVHHQTAVLNLSVHATCQMAYSPSVRHQGILADAGGAWKRLGERLSDVRRFSTLSAFRVSLSVILVQQDAGGEITQEACKEVEEQLSQEVEDLFGVAERALRLEICVQSFRELLPAADGWL